MSRDTDELRCPHCGATLSAFRIPESAIGSGGWSEDVQHACFNDDCPYFLEGWEWMWERYEARASYRYRVVGGEGGKSMPIPVCSSTMLRDLLMDEDG